jgi:hypothetical protein
MPMPFEFKSMNDLVAYLRDLEARLAASEQANAELSTKLQEADKRSLDVIGFVRENWPQTGLVSKSWWVRAFSVYGYFFVINLIISIILTIFSFLIFGSMMVGILNQLGQNGLPLQ